MKKVRFLSALMAVCMMLSLLPVSALAADKEHAPTCGYDCTHEHDEGCGYFVHSMQAEPCDHTDDCGYVAADVYGVCDCAAEAEDEGTLVHSDACASLNVVTSAAPCAHADGHETEVTSENADACTHTCGDDEWVCTEGCAVAERVEGSTALMDLNVENGQADAAVEEVMALVSELPAADSAGRVLAAYETEMNAAADAFGVLTEEQQVLVENAADLAAVQRALVQYKGTNPSDFISFEGYHDSNISIEVPYGTPLAEIAGMLPQSIRVVYTHAPGYAVCWDNLKDLAWKADKSYNAEVSGDYMWTLSSGKSVDKNGISANYGQSYATFYMSWLTSKNPSAKVPTVTVTVLSEPLPEAQEAVTVNLEQLDSVSSTADRLTAEAIPGSGNMLITHRTLSNYSEDTYRVEKFVLVSGGALTVTQTGWTDKLNTMSANIKIGAGIELNLVLDNLNIIGDSGNREVSALDIGTDAQVNLTLVGANTLKSGAAASGINVGQGATLVIDGAGSLTAQSSGDGAGIGFYDWKLLRNNEKIWFNVVGNNGFFDSSMPNYWVDPSYDPDTTLGIDYPTIRIKSGTVYAASGGGAGIGGGVGFSGGTIIIEEAASVTVRAGSGGSIPCGAGIGGGTYGNGGSITINGATVYALAQDSAAAIGGGKGGSAGTIVLEGGADVTAVGGWKNYAIGGGLDSQDTSGSLSVSSGVTLRAYAEGRSSKAVSVAPGNEDLFIYTPVAYTFAIDPNLNLAGDASILNGRFAELVYQYDRHQNKVPNVIYVEPIGAPDQAIRLELPHSYSDGQSVVQQRAYQAFATTVSLIDGQTTDFMVRSGNPDDTEGMYAKYSLKDSDTQLLFTVASGSMTTRDDLNWSYVITASAGANGAVSDNGMSAVDKDADKTYTFTPDSGYAVDTVTVDGRSVTVTGNTYTFEKVDAHHTIAVTFKTAPVTPPVDPGTPGVTTYTITVKYVKLNGDSLEKDYTAHKNSGASYDVSAQAAKAIEGYAIDHVDGAVKGTLHSDVTVTVYYKQNVMDVPDEPETDIPEEEPPLTDLPEVEIPSEDTPLAPLPEEEGDVVIVDPETPLGSLPQTGTGRSVDPAVTLGLLALTGSLAMAGLTVGMKKRKDGEAAE